MFKFDVFSFSRSPTQVCHVCDPLSLHIGLFRDNFSFLQKIQIKLFSFGICFIFSVLL